MKYNTPNYNPAINGDVFTALRQVVKTYLSDFLFTAEPMQVVKVNADSSLDLIPVISDKTTLGEEISITNDDIITNIKPLYLVGGGTEISFEAKTGDFGLLIACKKDITDFSKTHSESQISSLRQFSLSNGFFLPIDLFSAKKTCLTIKRENESSNSSIILDDSGIKITTDKDITIQCQNSTATIEQADTINCTDCKLTATGDTEITAANAKITAQQNVEITAVSAIIKSTDISLGGEGGKQVALHGDPVMAGSAIIGTVQASSVTTKAL